MHEDGAAGTRAGSTVPDAPAALGPLVSRVLRSLLGCGLLVVVGCIAYRHATHALNHDVSWLVVAARRLLEGGRFGHEIYELNVPGAVVAYLPVSVLWKLGLGSVTGLLIVYVVALTALCAGLLRRLLRPVLAPTAPVLLDALVVFAAALLLALPGAEFGQREHLIVLLLLPYSLSQSLVGGRFEPPRWLRVVSAVLAAVAFSVKPYFVLVPIALLAWQCLRQGIRAVVSGLEVRVFASLGLLYVAAIAAFFPGWIDIARHASQVYDAYAPAESFPPGSRYGLRLVLPPLALLVLAQRLPLRARSPELGRWTEALTILAAIALLVFLLQRRGWLYQLMPALVTLGLAYGLFVVQAAWSLRRRALHVAAVGLLGGLALALGVSAPVASSQLVARTDLEGWKLVQRLRRYADPPVMLFLSTSLVPAFPLVTELRLDWGSRFPCLWTLAGVRHHERRRERGDEAAAPAAVLRALEDETARMLAEDLRRYRPSVVAVDERTNRQALDDAFDILARLRSHAPFDAAFAPYVRVGEAQGFGLYQRRGAR